MTNEHYGQFDAKMAKMPIIAFLPLFLKNDFIVNQSDRGG